MSKARAVAIPPAAQTSTSASLGADSLPRGWGAPEQPQHTLCWSHSSWKLQVSTLLQQQGLESALCTGTGCSKLFDSSAVRALLVVPD